MEKEDVKRKSYALEDGMRATCHTCTSSESIEHPKSIKLALVMQNYWKKIPNKAGWLKLHLQRKIPNKDDYFTVKESTKRGASFHIGASIHIGGILRWQRHGLLLSFHSLKVKAISNLSPGWDDENARSPPKNGPELRTILLPSRTRYPSPVRYVQECFTLHTPIFPWLWGRWSVGDSSGGSSAKTQRGIVGSSRSCSERHAESGLEIYSRITFFSGLVTAMLWYSYFVMYFFI